MDRKYTKLQSVLNKLKAVLIAYSGGVDSTFLLAAAVNTLGPENVTAVTAVSETYPAAELKQAKLLTKKLGVRNHIVIHTAELSDKKFSGNDPNRCFYCKSELFKKLTQIAKQRHLVLCDATNYSDRTDYRPGRRAAQQWHVVSPLLQVKMTKNDIRRESRAMKLPTWNQPAQACLASRIPFGTSITSERLKRIERGEEILKRAGFPLIRLRDHGDLVRIETDTRYIPKLIVPALSGSIIRALKKLGWRYVTIDLEGYRTGSFNPPR